MSFWHGCYITHNLTSCHHVQRMAVYFWSEGRGSDAYGKRRTVEARGDHEDDFFCFSFFAGFFCRIFLPDHSLLSWPPHFLFLCAWESTSPPQTITMCSSFPVVPPPVANLSVLCVCPPKYLRKTRDTCFCCCLGSSSTQRVDAGEGLVVRCEWEQVPFHSSQVSLLQLCLTSILSPFLAAHLQHNFFHPPKRSPDANWPSKVLFPTLLFGVKCCGHPPLPVPLCMSPSDPPNAICRPSPTISTLSCCHS